MKRTGNLLILAALALAEPLLAQETDDATRSVARDLGYQGVDAYKAGDYATAVDKLGRAFAAVRMPTLGLWLARALVQQGKLVEASERYAEVERCEVAAGQVATQKEAQSEAAAERLALVPRVPGIRIDIQGTSPSEVQVTIDGVPVPTALLGVSLPVNPGPRKIVGQRGEQVVTKDTEFAEGQSQTVVLDFGAAPVSQVNPAPPLAQPPEPPPLEKRRDTPAGGVHWDGSASVSAVLGCWWAA